MTNPAPDSTTQQQQPEMAEALHDMAGQLRDLAAACERLAAQPGTAGLEVTAGRNGSNGRGHDQLPFTITPLGGAEEVGGSALLVETPHGTVLLDAGQRVKGEYGDPEADGQFHFLVPGVDRLDAILVSHAHIDHVGSLPILARDHARAQGDPPQIWMSEPTADLAGVMLRDSAAIQASRARQDQDVLMLAGADLPAEGIMRCSYELHDVTAVMDQVRHAQPDQAIRIPGTELVAKFQPVSHVLGACAIHLRHLPTGASLLYTGDLGPFTDPQETLHPRIPGQTLDPADIVIMESTYGSPGPDEQEGKRSRLSGRQRTIQRLADVAGKALERGGFVLLPAFSLGRTQELLRILASPDLPEAPIYVGGMGEVITTHYSDWAARRDGVWAAPGRFASGVTSVNRWVAAHQDFNATAAEILGDQPPGYIICSPAMLSGGWSRAFFDHMIDDERHAIVVAGYVAPHAGGIRDIHQIRKGQTIQVGTVHRTVRCDWAILSGLSAHAPLRDLHRFATDIARGRSVAFACVHGERAAQEQLAGWIASSVPDATAHSMQRGVPWQAPRR